MLRHSDLIAAVKAYDPDADGAAIERAYLFAAEAHGSQQRASGDPYISHPLAVAEILRGNAWTPPRS